MIENIHTRGMCVQSDPMLSLEDSVSRLQNFEMPWQEMIAAGASHLLTSQTRLRGRLKINNRNIFTIGLVNRTLEKCCDVCHGDLQNTVWETSESLMASVALFQNFETLCQHSVEFNCTYIPSKPSLSKSEDNLLQSHLSRLRWRLHWPKMVTCGWLSIWMNRNLQALNAARMLQGSSNVLHQLSHRIPPNIALDARRATGLVVKAGVNVFEGKKKIHPHFFFAWRLPSGLTLEVASAHWPV